MKIVISAWHIRDFNVGLGRYSRALIEALGRVDKENHYEVLMPDGSYQFPERTNIRYRIIRIPFGKRRLWEQAAPLLVGRYDVLHFPYDSCVAVKRGRFVATVHDVKPLLFEEVRSRTNLNSLVARALVGNRWTRIDHVVTVSRCSKLDIVEHVGFPEDRITVVYQGVELERFHPRQVDRADPSIPPTRPYVLCVGGADPTKNLETLVDAFARVVLPIRESYDLILAGDLRRRSDLRERAACAGIEKQTLFTGVVSDERLIELYQEATLFVFPSRYEGFGFPVLEAMACGCPVISSNGSSLPEVAGDAAILVDPSDSEGLARSIERVLSDSDLRQDLRARGLRQASRFSWDRTARDTIAVYRKLSAGSSPGMHSGLRS